MTVNLLVWHWRFRFVRDVLSPITEMNCSAKEAKYSEIESLDLKIREFQPHPDAFSYIDMYESAGVHLKPKIMFKCDPLSKE